MMRKSRRGAVIEADTFDINVRDGGRLEGIGYAADVEIPARCN
jgi:hypothetical protein